MPWRFWLGAVKGEIMFHSIGKPKDGFIAFHITGELSDKETERIIHEIQSNASPEGKVRLFLLIEQYTSFNSAEDLYYDLRFAKSCADLIERMVIVGDRSWKSTLVGLFGLFSSIETAYFDRSDGKAAWEWLVQNG